MGRFKNLKDANVVRRTNRLTDGRYDLVVKEIRETGRNRDYFCAELLILECEQLPQHPYTKEDYRQLTRGSEVSILYQYNDPWDTSWGHIKAFLLGTAPDGALDDLDEDGWDAFGEAAIGPDQPLRGVVLHVTATTSPQQKDPNKYYTHLAWSPASDETIERYADDVAELLGR